MGIPASLEAFGFDTTLGSILLLEQIQGKVPQDCKVLCTIALANPAIILTESNVQHPMHGIFDFPVSPNCVEHLLGFAGQTGNEKSVLDARFITKLTFGSNHRNRLQVLPSGQTSQVK